jgi:two-component system sensor histidine kinase CiaH
LIKKLRRKFIAVIMCIVTVMITVVFVCVLYFTQNNMEKMGVNVLRQAIGESGAPRPNGIGQSIVPAQSANPSQPADMNQPNNAFQHEKRLPTLITTIDSGGTFTIIGNRFESIGDSDAAEISELALIKGGETGVLKDYALRYLIEKDNQGNTTLVFSDTSMETQIIENLLMTSALIGSATLLLFFAASIFLARWMVRPVETAWERQRQFIADASHELRTPLTVVLSNAAILIEHQTSDDPKNKARLENIAEEAKRMKQLVEDMLSLAKPDGSGPKPVLGSLNYSYLVNSIVLMFEAGIFESGKRFKYEIQDGISVMGDESKLRQLTEILLDNACKYSAPEGLISVRLQPDKNDAVLEIANEGETIPQEELAKIFERFYRADKARSSGGYGLGLAIAKTIVTEHEGKITVKSEDGLTTFCVQLPQA